MGGLTIAGSLGIMTILAQLTELNIFAQSVVTLIGLGIAIDTTACSSSADSARTGREAIRRELRYEER